jgi:hypothetical protein
MDGNNSMKRVDGAAHSDAREFNSDYLIPPTEVDAFKDDVQSRLKDQSPDVNPERDICTDNWTAANMVNEGTINIFDQTGGFVSTCRHAIVETFVEMRRSGELSEISI